MKPERIGMIRAFKEGSEAERNSKVAKVFKRIVIVMGEKEVLGKVAVVVVVVVAVEPGEDDEGEIAEDWLR